MKKLISKNIELVSLSTQNPQLPVILTVQKFENCNDICLRTTTPPPELVITSKGVFFTCPNTHSGTISKYVLVCNNFTLLLFVYICHIYHKT